VGIAQLAAARDRFQQQATTAAAPQRPASPNSSSCSTNSSAVSSPAAAPQRRIRVGMVGCCGGSDALGEYGRAQMQAAGVDMVTVDGLDMAGSTTGTVMVFTTPDAQRSFLSSFSSEDRVWLSPELLGAVSRARLLVIEGYLWELPGAAEVIPAVVKHARAVGTLTVLTAGDASVVQRHGEKVLEAVQAGVDMFVSNVAEAAELQKFLQQQQQQQPQQAEARARLLHQQQEMQLHSVLLDAQGSASSLDSMWEAGSSSSSIGSGMLAANGSSSAGQVVACELAGVCPLVVVTDGSRGSYMTALGQLIVVPPYWRSHAPLDTCGAGDAYCSGFLFAFLLGLDLHAMGHLAAKTASAVISRHGPQLLPNDADAVAGVPLSKVSLAARFMGSSSNSSSSTSLAAMQLQALGLGVDDASQLLQGASQ
jgi:sugar/nucleoside kinase (ribokinase family)